MTRSLIRNQAADDDIVLQSLFPYILDFLDLSTFGAQGVDEPLTSAAFTPSRTRAHLRPDQEGTRGQRIFGDRQWSTFNLDWVSFCLPVSQDLTVLADIKARPDTSILRSSRI